MEIQPYCMVDEIQNVCYNVCMWDGDTHTWPVPPNTLMLLQATTPAIVWVWDAEIKDYVLGEVMGAGEVGFTWDGTYLTTTQPKPIAVIAADQPTTTGTQTL